MNNVNMRIRNRSQEKHHIIQLTDMVGLQKDMFEVKY